MKILDLYKSVLGTASLFADKEGNISATMRGNTIPFTIGGKRLVLPTPEHLANPDRSNREIFHPLSENILRGESVIMEKFRGAINTRLNFVLGSLIDELLILGTSVGEHSKLSPDQSSILSIMKDADEKTLTNFKSILKEMGIGNKEKCIVHIFLKRGGVISGKKYNRAAIVSFPLYKEIEKDEKQVYGVTVRKKDREIYLKLLEYVIPGMGTDSFFDKGSESDIAPFLDAIMRCLMGIASRINLIVSDYKMFLDKPDEFLYSDEWVEVFDNLSQMLPEIRAIPMQAGNEGKIENSKFAPAQHQTFAVAPAAVAPQHNVVLPATVHAPVVTTPPITSNGGLDFAAIMRGNPALAAAANPGFGMFNNVPVATGPNALRSGTPAWAQPNIFGNQGNWQNNQPMNRYGNI